MEAFFFGDPLEESMYFAHFSVYFVVFQLNDLFLEINFTKATILLILVDRCFVFIETNFMKSILKCFAPPLKEPRGPKSFFLSTLAFKNHILNSNKNVFLIISSAGCLKSLCFTDFTHLSTNTDLLKGAKLRPTLRKMFIKLTLKEEFNCTMQF